MEYQSIGVSKITKQMPTDKLKRRVLRREKTATKTSSFLQI